MYIIEIKELTLNWNDIPQRYSWLDGYKAKWGSRLIHIKTQVKLLKANSKLEIINRSWETRHFRRGSQTRAKNDQRDLRAQTWDTRTLKIIVKRKTFERLSNS